MFTLTGCYIIDVPIITFDVPFTCHVHTAYHPFIIGGGIEVLQKHLVLFLGKFWYQISLKLYASGCHLALLSFLLGPPIRVSYEFETTLFLMTIFPTKGALLFFFLFFIFFDRFLKVLFLRKVETFVFFSWKVLNATCSEGILSLLEIYICLSSLVVKWYTIPKGETSFVAKIWVLITINSTSSPMRNLYRCSFSWYSLILFPISHEQLLQEHLGRGKMDEVSSYSVWRMVYYMEMELWKCHLVVWRLFSASARKLWGNSLHQISHASLTTSAPLCLHILRCHECSSPLR